MIDIALYLKEQALLIEQELDKLLPKENYPYGHLFEAARYAVLGKGKRLRPILALAVCKLFGGNESCTLKLACALEFIHCYSLIHDDLPCMDNDDFRRGKPTLHKVFPEAVALLTGDFLLTYSFEVIATDSNCSAEQKIRLIELLAKKAGAHGMIGGQIMDITVNQNIDLEHLKAIHNGKTGALIAASLEFGAIIAQAEEAQLVHLRAFASDLGLAFQIVDDILDVTACEVKHGRSVPTDEINQKATYVTLLGLQEAKEAAIQALNNAKNHLRKLKPDSTLLDSLADALVFRKT